MFCALSPCFLRCVALFSLVSVFVVSRFVIWMHLKIELSPSLDSLSLSKSIIYEYFYGRIEDVICVASHIAVSLYMLAMVLAGPCPDSDFDNQLQQVQCNPQAVHNGYRGFPTEQYVILFLVPILSVLFFRGTTWVALLLSWAISTTLVIGMFYVGSFQQYWALAGIIVVPLLVVYEIERGRLEKFFGLKNHFSWMQALNENEVLQKSNESRKLIIRYLSHEIRSPLNVVSVGVDLALGDLKSIPDLPKKMRTDLLDVALAVKSVVGVVDHLTYVEDILSDNFYINRAWVEVSEYLPAKLKQLWSQHTGIPAAEGISDHVTIADADSTAPAQLAYMFIDDVKLAQICKTMFENASKFIPKGGRVGVSLRFDERHARMECFQFPKNSQCKMLEAELRHSLEDDRVSPTVVWIEISSNSETHDLQQHELSTEFSKIEDISPQGGGSSGLWVAREIASRHGGQLTFSSPGSSYGSTFLLGIPAFTVKQEKEVNAYKRRAAKSRATMTEFDASLTHYDDGFRPLRILVVDDCAMNRKILCRVINSRAKGISHDILEAEDGVEAVELMRESMYYMTSQKIDVVFLDNFMVRMHGPETAKVFRSLGFTGLIIGVTGNVLEEDTRDFISSGADEVMRKPVIESRIFDLLSSLSLAPEEQRRPPERAAAGGDNSSSCGGPTQSI